MPYKRLERILIQLDAVDSTNEYASQLVKSSIVSSGTTVLTKHQRSGRGQRSAIWTTEEGKNLTFSTIIFPDLLASKVFYLNMIASLAVHKTLSDLGLKAKIKWPNDILIEGKKICGILVENVFSGNKLNSAVVGIGLNVNQVEFGELLNATSLKSEKGVEFELDIIFDQLFAYLDFYYNLLCESHFKVLKDRYYEQMYKINEPSFFKSAEKRFEGVILGIAESGLLLVDVDGKQETFDIKEIAFV